MNITKIQILTNRTTSDLIILNTDLPSATWPYGGYESFRANAASGCGMEYVSKHFPGIEVEVIKLA